MAQKTTFLLSAALALLVACNQTTTESDPPCPDGRVGCACTAAGACEAGLSCVDATCVDPCPGLSGGIVFSGRETAGGPSALYRLDLAAGSTTKVSSSSASATDIAHFAVAPNGCDVAYLEEDVATSALTLTVARSDGAEATSVPGLADAYSYAEVSWSPTGEDVAFMASGSTASNGSIDVVGRDGTNVRRVSLTDTVSDTSQVAWSPDGAYLAYVGPGSGRDEAYVARADGSETAAVSAGRTDTDDVANLAWSPVGNELAYEPWLGAELHAVAIGAATSVATASDRVSVAPDGGAYFQLESWAAGSGRIAYSRDVGATRTLRLASPQGDIDVGIVLGDAGYEPTNCAWAAGAERLFCSASAGLSTRIFAISGDGADVVMVPPGELSYAGFRPNLMPSPDGVWLAYAARAAVVVDELYLTGGDGSVGLKISGPASDGLDVDQAMVRWAPTSDAVAFIAAGGGASGVFVVDVASGTETEVSVARPDGSVRELIWSLDGTQLVYVWLRADGTREFFAVGRDGAANRALDFSAFASMQLLRMSR